MTWCCQLGGCFFAVFDECCAESFNFRRISVHSPHLVMKKSTMETGMGDFVEQDGAGFEGCLRRKLWYRNGLSRELPADKPLEQI